MHKLLEKWEFLLCLSIELHQYSKYENGSDICYSANQKHGLYITGPIRPGKPFECQVHWSVSRIVVVLVFADYKCEGTPLTFILRHLINLLLVRWSCNTLPPFFSSSRILASLFRLVRIWRCNVYQQEIFMMDDLYYGLTCLSYPSYVQNLSNAIWIHPKSFYVGVSLNWRQVGIKVTPSRDIARSSRAERICGTGHKTTQLNVWW